MIIGVDHALVAVESLDAGMRTYRRLGFQVTRGGSHPNHGTHNALVPLSDGFYLELMGVWDRPLARQHPHTNRVVEALDRDNRLATFALDAGDLDADVASARERGLPISDPVPGERERPDGERVAWRTAHPDDPRLPFLIEDETPRSVRVPEASEGVGADLRIAQLVVGAGEVGEVSAPYARLLGGPSDARSFGTDRGDVCIEPGERPHALDRLVLAADDPSRVAEAWTKQGVSFQDAKTEDGARILVPRDTAGVAIWVVQLAR